MNLLWIVMNFCERINEPFVKTVMNLQVRQKLTCQGWPYTTLLVKCLDMKYSGTWLTILKGLWWVNLKEEYLEDLVLDERKMLKGILNKLNWRAWASFIWVLVVSCCQHSNQGYSIYCTNQLHTAGHCLLLAPICATASTQGPDPHLTDIGTRDPNISGNMTRSFYCQLQEKSFYFYWNHI